MKSNWPLSKEKYSSPSKFNNCGKVRDTGGTCFPQLQITRIVPSLPADLMSLLCSPPGTARVQAALLRCTSHLDASGTSLSSQQEMQTVKPTIAPAIVQLCLKCSSLISTEALPLPQASLPAAKLRSAFRGEHMMPFFLAFSFQLHKAMLSSIFHQSTRLTNDTFIFVPDMKQTLQSSYEWNRMPISFLRKCHKNFYYFPIMNRSLLNFKPFSEDSASLKPRH